MAAISKPTKDTRFNENLESALVVRKGEIDPLIDRVNSITTSDGKITLNANGSVTSPSIVTTGAAGVYIGPTTAGLTTAGSHYALLTGGGVLTSLTTATTGGFAGSGTNQIVPIHIAAAQNDIAASNPGAIPITNYFTTVNSDAGGDVWTLADGACIGQLKKIAIKVRGGAATVTGKLNAAGAALTLTFANAGEYAIFMWNGTGWVPMELASQSSATQAPTIA
jgi:hypothetical protein